jgi:hypothetical protein
MNRHSSLAFCLAIMLAAPIAAQQISGSISGVVRDTQQAVVAGAKVTLTSATQGSVRETSTNADGIYLFQAIQPDTYTVAVEAAGFKKSERREIRIFASDRLDVPVTLEVG